MQVARAIGEENVLQSQAANSLVSLGDHSTVEHNLAFLSQAQACKGDK